MQMRADNESAGPGHFCLDLSRNPTAQGQGNRLQLNWTDVVKGGKNNFWRTPIDWFRWKNTWGEQGQMITMIFQSRQHKWQLSYHFSLSSLCEKSWNNLWPSASLSILAWSCSRFLPVKREPLFSCRCGISRVEPWFFLYKLRWISISQYSVFELCICHFSRKSMS